jgi:hypothetical protein
MTERQPDPVWDEFEAHDVENDTVFDPVEYAEFCAYEDYDFENGVYDDDETD